MFVLHLVLVGDDAFFPMVEAIVALWVSEPEEVVMLIADSGAEMAGFEDGLGKNNLRIFDTVSL